MIVAIIQARLGSTRLPGKVLREIVPGKTCLEFMIERVKRSKKIDLVVIATTCSENDNPIVDFCKSKSINFFRGSEDDVLSRYYHCARENNATTIVRLTSDCPLVDPALIDKCINIYSSSELDYFSNTCPPSKSKYPDGADVEVFSMESLSEANKDAIKLSDREHVTFYMWKDSNKFKTGILESNIDLSKYRYTVDYPEDLEVASFLANYIQDKNISGTAEEISKILDKNTQIFELNSSYYAGIGWKNNHSCEDG